MKRRPLTAIRRIFLRLDRVITLPETNSLPLKNGWLEDYIPIGKVTFQGYVKLREGNVFFEANHL